MHTSFHWVVAYLALACQAAPATSTPLHCNEVLIPVEVSAKNFALPSNLTAENITVPYIKSLGSHPDHDVAGNFTIGARYCEPVQAVSKRHNTLQLLVHGITYTRDYWSGLAAPGTKSGQDRYSWILYAAERGYPTLSIDRLCNGLSSHPDGISDCQIPLEVETIHALIKKARAGTLPVPNKSRKFDKILYVGHSEGSELGDYLAIKHPQDADALLLTGFSFNLTNSFSAAGLLGIEPAAKALPSRYGYLEPSYLAVTNLSAVEDFFYTGDYSHSFAKYDFVHRGTVALGELISCGLGQLAAPDYRGPLFVLDGNLDATFCSPSSQTSDLSLKGNCSAGFDPVIRKLFPNVATFDFYNTADTGHCLNLHLTAQRSYRAAHDWLAKEGF